MELTDTCYTLVDKMFTRRFFTLVSWAGGSKKGTAKIEFRSYKRTIAFFLELVRQKHPFYSEQSCEDFFKNKVISNSTKRSENKRLRKSHAKHRGKSSVKLEIKNDESNDEDSIDENLFHNAFDDESVNSNSKDMSERWRMLHPS